MALSRIRIQRTELDDADGQSVASMLRFVLGYETLPDINDGNDSESPYVARLCRDIDDARLAADWAALEAKGVASVFQSYTWQRGLIAHLGTPEIEPLFVTLNERRSNRLVAIFPLQRRHRPGAVTIEYLFADFCDTCQPLLSAEAPPTAAAAFAATLVAALPAADILRLSKMPRTLFGHANPFADLPGGDGSADMTFPVELHADRDGFVGATSAYKAYQKQWRKLSRREGVAFELFETPEAIGTAFDRMIAMRNTRFTELNRDDLLNDRRVAAFYRAMALLPAAERVVRIAGLKVGDAYTAYIYMMDRGGKFSTVISAIDHSVGNAYAPGLILFTKIFERAHTEGYAFGDIGIGHMHYKTRFAPAPNPLIVWEQALSLKGRVALAAIRSLRAAKHFAKSNRTIRAITETILRRKLAGQPAVKVETTEEA